MAAFEEKKSAWEARVLELKMRGLTDASVSNQMRGEGYEKVSVRSIRRYIAEERGKGNWDLVEELQRQQLADITMVDERELKLRYRDRLLDKLMPRRFEQTLSGGISQDVKVKQDISDEQFAKFVPVIADMVMGEQARRANQPHDQEGATEPLDTPDSYS